MPAMSAKIAFAIVAPKLDAANSVYIIFSCVISVKWDTHAYHQVEFVF